MPADGVNGLDADGPEAVAEATIDEAAVADTDTAATATAECDADARRTALSAGSVATMLTGRCTASTAPSLGAPGSGANLMTRKASTTMTGRERNGDSSRLAIVYCVAYTCAARVRCALHCREKTLIPRV